MGELLRALDAIILQVDEGAYHERERLAAAKREVKAHAVGARPADVDRPR